MTMPVNIATGRDMSYHANSGYDSIHSGVVDVCHGKIIARTPINLFLASGHQLTCF